MENRAHALAAGLFVLLLGIAVALAVWWFGGTREITRDLILVTQRNITGLNPQAQVRFRGISAGKVLSIALDPYDARNILVRISVDASLPLTKSTTAQLNYQGVTGLAYVQLEDSRKSQEPLPLDDGPPPRIPLQPTLFDSLGDRATDIVSQVGEVAINLNRLLDEHNLRNLNRTLENIANATDGLKQMPQLLAGLKAALSEENLKRLQNILAHLERTAGEAAPLSVELRALVVAMQSASKRFDEVTDRVSGELSDGTLPRFNALVSDLHANSRQLKRILERLDESPQSLIFGHPAPKTGPGESGFVPPGN